MGHSATGDIVAGLAILLLLAVGTLALCNRFRFPFSIALLLLGMLLSGLAHVAPAWYGVFGHLEISADLIIYVFLPTLVFESACHLEWRQLRKDLGAILFLAVPGLLLSTVIIGYALH
jgi:monovalent cation:H+ antiporter, CPA1 family